MTETEETGLSKSIQAASQFQGPPSRPQVRFFSVSEYGEEGNPKKETPVMQQLSS
jgi:hypothetical protein